MRAPLTVAVDRARGHLVVAGELAGEEARALGPALVAAEGALPPGELRVDLDGLEALDGVATAISVSALRALLDLRERVRLLAPPQMLAHTLYRVGALESGRLRLEDVRAEEPTTAN